jgi:subtilisin-like proprotein convertase family protein
LGTYTVTVRGSAVNGPRQGYALVISGDVVVAPPDCNTNGIPDDLDLAGGTSQDCNSSGVPDECEAMTDCDSNGTPDECEWFDCNTNGVLDRCDIADGFSADCNTNGFPDECDVAAGTSPDCNGNDVPDVCDVDAGTSSDCNRNDVPDECEVVAVHTVSPNLPIPDGDSQGVSSTLQVAEHYTVYDVDLDLNVTHGWTGDLVVTVSHNGITRTVIHRPGYPDLAPPWGFNDTGLDVTLDDDATVSIEEYTTGGGVVTGTFSPYPHALSAFAGMDAYGEWIVTVADVEAVYSGTFDTWGLRIALFADPTGLCPGDCNADSLISLDDFQRFGECLSGPGGGLGDQCACADIDQDGDTDLHDHWLFAEMFTGSNPVDAVPAPPLATGPPSGPDRQ